MKLPRKTEPPSAFPSAQTGRLPLDAEPGRRRFCAAASGLGLTVAAAQLLAGCSSPPRGPAMRHAVAPFSQSPPGSELPAGWRQYIMRPDRLHTVYEIVERDGIAVLHAIADGASTGVHCAVDIDPHTSPWLRWRWRVDSVDEGASVAEDITEDTPARLVVAFDGDMGRLTLRDRIFFEQVDVFTGNVLPYATLAYVWDGQLHVGSVLPYARSGRIRYDVVESGAARTGRWLGYERNLLEDYQRVFGEPVSGHVLGIGILTDSDDRKVHAEAWYGDIGLYPSPSPSRGGTR